MFIGELVSQMFKKASGISFNSFDWINGPFKLTGIKENVVLDSALYWNEQIYKSYHLIVTEPEAVTAQRQCAFC